jgi:iron complex outermembrane receptor protein
MTKVLKIALKATVASAAFAIAFPAFAQEAADTEEAAENGEIVVTATRKSEALSKVPLSVSAFSAETLEERGIRDFGEVIRQTPGITFESTNTTTNIAIRGINSSVGASTTGVYIDDTPVQVRALGYSGGTVFPVIFDLERIEVLRGPQGTLFGSGSQGGTIRFISPQADATETSGRARAELAFTENGSPSYEGGLAVNTPLVADMLAIRASAYYRRQGGFIDRVRFEDRSVVDKDANYTNSFVGRLSLAWTPTPELTVTPSLVYQRIYTNDSPESWDNLRRDLNVPDRQFSDYENGVFLNGNRVQESGRDRFILPAINISYDLGGAELVAIGSYFDRRQEFDADYTTFDQSLFTGITLPIFPNQSAVSGFVNTQKNLTAELRLQSTDNGGMFSWVVGGFFQSAKQLSVQQVDDRFLFQYAPFLIPVFPPLVDGRLIYDQATRSKDTQLAMFGQVNFRPVDRLTLTLGLRYGETKFAINSFARGPVVGPPVTDVGTQKEKPFTPKFGVDFQVTDSTLLYGSVAKGFRPGGYNPQVGSPCAPELRSIGYPNGRPELYNSDSVWSYEAGVKTRTSRFGVQASAYQINWKDIQQNVGINSCGFQFTANLGDARSRGFDVQMDWKVTDALTLQAEVGYTDAKFLKTFFGGPTATVPLVSDGNNVIAPPWTMSLHGQYDFTVGSNDAYIRADFDYQAKQKSTPASLDPRNGGVDLTLSTAPAIKALSMRAGYKLNGFDISVFANNLLDQAVWAGRRQRDNGLATIYRSHIVRPRTVGVTVSYDF